MSTWETFSYVYLSMTAKGRKGGEVASLQERGQEKDHAPLMGLGRGHTHKAHSLSFLTINT